MFMNKKGVSPIIAAILLVVITIAIGATTMAFIRGLSDESISNAQEQSSQIKCGTDVNLEVISINNEYKICKESFEGITVTLKNKGFVDIKKFKLIVLGNGSVGAQENETADIDFAVNTIRAFTLNYTNSTALGEPQEYSIEPIIQGDPGQNIYCSDVSLNWKASDLSSC